MDKETIIKLHNVYDNMILGNIKLAHEELGSILNNCYCSCEMPRFDLENTNFCTVCNKIIDWNSRESIKE